MIRITTPVTIRGKSPEQVTDFLLNLTDERWRGMYPEHMEFREIKRTKEGVGGIVMLDQHGAGLRLKGTFEFEVVEKGSRLELRARTLFPFGRLVGLCPVREVIALKKSGRDTELSHELQIGPSSPIVSAVIDRLLRMTVLTPDRIKRIDDHVVDEFRSLEHLQ